MKKNVVKRLLGLGMAVAMTLSGPAGLNQTLYAYAAEDDERSENPDDEEEKKDEEEKEEEEKKEEEKEEEEKKEEYTEEKQQTDDQKDNSVEIDKVVVNTEVTKLGQYPKDMVVTLKSALPEGVTLAADDFTIAAKVAGWLNPTTTDKNIKIDSVTVNEERTQVTLVPETFPEKYYYVPEYTVTNSQVEGFTFTKAQTNTVTPIADDFTNVKGDENFSYNYYAPSTNEKAPVVIVFHGFGDDENLYANRIAVEWATKDSQSKHPAYVIAPQFGGYNFMNPDARKTVYEKTKAVVDSLVEDGKVDENRIYVTGKSFGGASVIEFNELYPDYAAASISMAPAVAYTTYFPGVAAEEQLKKIKDNSIWVAQCQDDNTAPYTGTKAMMDTLKSLSAADITLTTYTMKQLNNAGAGGDAHAIETIVMEDGRYADWLFAHKKGEVAKENYEVILPDGYDASKKSYPTLYVMPNDGLDSFSSNMMEQINATFANTMDMIVVKVSFDESDSPYEAVERIINEVDRKYRTAVGPQYRAVIGEEVGGYLAHAMTYTNGKKSFNATPKLFGLMASINGDYATDANQWLDKYGDMLAISKLNNSTALKFYTYLTTASEDERSTAANGANSVIKYFIGNASAYGGFFTGYFGNADEYSQNFTIKNGSFTTNFEKKAVKEAVTGFNRRLNQNLVSGSLSLSPQATLADAEDISATATITVDNKYETYFGEDESDLQISIVMVNPDNGEVIHASDAKTIQVKPGNFTETFTLPNDVRNVSTSVSLVASLQGTRFVVDSQDLVRILETGQAPEDQVIDFMGTWKVKTVAESAFNKADWVDSEGILSLGNYNEWSDATPCLTWWNGANGVEKNYVGYAWYVKEFDIPDDFPLGTYQMPIGYLDEGDVTFINGVQIGQTGMTADTWRFESDQWDTYRSYEVSSDILNIGGHNYIAVLAHNKSGDGGWYKGHPGLYSQAAFNKLNSVPSVKAEEVVTEEVLATVEIQLEAIRNKDIRGFAATVAPNYFQSGNTKEMLLDTIKDYFSGNGTVEVEDAEANVYVAEDGLFLYQARRSVKTASGKTITLDIQDYFKMDGDEAKLFGLHDRFFTQYIESEHRAKALGQEGTATENFLVYLPEGYFDEENADKRYPVAYIFHQINSSSNSWKIDGINELLDKGIAEGDIKNTILIIPDSVPDSWWRGEWINMVTEDIIPFVDATYRTVDDARFRFTVGASMGGSGSYNIGLRNPNKFSGIISYFGAINMGDAPLNIAKSQYEKGYTDYLKYYTQYFVCGNQDLYKFGMPAIELDAILRNVKIDHFFELEEGAHDSTFYKPYVIDSFKYVTSKIDSVNANQANDALYVEITKADIYKEQAKIAVNVKAKEALKEYFAEIPESDFTEDTTPDLVVPVTARIVDAKGVTVASLTKNVVLSRDVVAGKTFALSFDIKDFDLAEYTDYTVYAAANLLDYPTVFAVERKSGGDLVVVSNPATPTPERTASSGVATPASVAAAIDAVQQILEPLTPTTGKTAKAAKKSAGKMTVSPVLDEVIEESDATDEVATENQTVSTQDSDKDTGDVSDSNAIDANDVPLSSTGFFGSPTSVLALILALALVVSIGVAISYNVRKKK